MPQQATRRFIDEDAMIHIAADYSRNAFIDICAPWLIHRQSIARRLLEGHYTQKEWQGLIEMLNTCNKEIALMLGLQPPQELLKS